MHWRILSVCLSLCFSVAARAADPDLAVTVTGVSEQRNSSTNLHRPNTCVLHLKIEGNLAEQSMGVLETRVIKAENNLGESLVLQKTEPLYEMLRRRLTFPVLEVRTSSRQATTLTVEGEADFFYPSPETGSRGVLTNFIADPDVWLPSPELTRAGLKLMFVGRENYHAFLKDWTEQKRGWHSSSGAITNPDKGKCALRFRIEGGGRKLASLEVEDSTGKRHQPVGVMVTENYRIIDFASPPPSDSRLILYLDIPEARKTVPFKLENIALP